MAAVLAAVLEALLEALLEAVSEAALLAKTPSDEALRLRLPLPLTTGVVDTEAAAAAAAGLVEEDGSAAGPWRSIRGAFMAEGGGGRRKINLPGSSWDGIVGRAEGVDGRIDGRWRWVWTRVWWWWTGSTTGRRDGLLGRRAILASAGAWGGPPRAVG